MGSQAGWLDRGQHLIARGAWVAARDVFAEALVEVAGGADEAAAADGLAQAAWELDDGNLVIVARERAYRSYRAAGDRLGAARMATWLGLDAIHFRGETAVAQGWFGRAHRLLPRQPESLEHALLPLFEGQVALRVDRDAARHWGWPMWWSPSARGSGPLTSRSWGWRCVALRWLARARSPRACGCSMRRPRRRWEVSWTS